MNEVGSAGEEAKLFVANRCSRRAGLSDKVTSQDQLTDSLTGSKTKRFVCSWLPVNYCFFKKNGWVLLIYSRLKLGNLDQIVNSDAEGKSQIEI